MGQLHNSCVQEQKGAEEVGEELFSKHACAELKQDVNRARRNDASIDDDEIIEMKTASCQFLRKYKLGKRLAAGAQGVTYLATQIASGNTVVVKKPNDPTDIGDYDQLVNKTHPHIVRVFEAFSTPLETFIVMECCAGGDLFGAIEALGQPTQNWCAAVFQQVVKGVNYLHIECNESHNDLKPENILLDRKPAGSHDVPRAMIGDFGCVAQRKTVTQETGGGDPRYRAPETFMGEWFSARTDVWSLGVTLFEIVTGGLLIYVNTRNISGWGSFQTAQNGMLCNQFMSMLQAGQPVDISTLLGDSAWTVNLKILIENMLNTQPDDRVKLDVALQNPWFQLANIQQPVALDQKALQSLSMRAGGHRLHMALLRLIGDKLQGDALSYYQELWDQYDLTDNGTMCFDEFKTMLHELGVVNLWSLRGKADAMRLFRIADIDCNGSVNFTEFVAVMFNPDKLDDKDKWRFFESLFTDIAGEDDVIRFEDLAAFFPNDNQVVRELFSRMDVDGSYYIDYREFSAYIQTL
eukprot:TRINITY_DN31370_c0_g1_i1.p1 TRINITY_DN31370_c0_g1~~TRINITY_DN31370_c0_g1_i1.p1  ORF type:complete len:522 (-),score=75.67 TRINITY_DN31370_c0_g1_i1:241-1806(-)